MNLARILANLTAWIPTPRRAAPTPQQSFASLKVGQHLVNRTPFYVGLIDTLVMPGARWVVTGTDNMGAYARYNEDDRVTVRLGRDWRNEFDRAPAQRSKRARSSELEQDRKDPKD